MTDVPRTRYATTTDGAAIAFQLFGSGPNDLVYSPGWVTNIEVLWEWPAVAATFDRLARSFRVALYDKRGTGLSDRVSSLPDLEARMDDLHAVMEEADMGRATLFGTTQGAAVNALYTATFPDRVDAFVSYGGFARASWAPDYPWGADPREDLVWERKITTDWGTEPCARFAAGAWGGDALREDPAFLAWLAKLMRFSSTPTAAIEFSRMFDATDVRPVLPTIAVPSLMLHRAGHDEGEEVDAAAALVPSAQVIELPADHWNPYLGDPEPMANAIETFVAGLHEHDAELDRVLATVLFTDIVDSTAQSAAAGDHAWRATREQHDRIVRSQIARFRGREIKTMGDGFLATFDGPARGIRCAESIAHAVRGLGIEIRAGLHTGEVALEGSDVAGIGVAIGARIGALAGPSEVLVSQTVKDLVAGSGLAFEDAGERELKGVPDRWRLYRVAA
jgi:class 3 adenylate cyclase